MNLATVVSARLGEHGDRVALRLGSQTVTYTELDRTSRQVAGLLAKHGVRPGDRVAVMLPNIPEFASVYYGILRTGAVVVPMNPLLKTREVRYYLHDSGASLIFAWHDPTSTAHAIAAAANSSVRVVVVAEDFTTQLAEHHPVDRIVGRAPNDTAVLLYTSGTTGRPKGAELTHANLLNNADCVQRDLLRFDRTDVVFGGLPLFHSFGQTVTLNTTMAAGASLVLMTRFDPAAAVDLIAATQVTVFAGVPTMYSALLAVSNASALPALRVCVSGGAALPVEVLHRFEEQFGCAVLEGYGLSETSPVASFNQPGRIRKPGSIGTPIAGVQIRIVDAAGRPVGPGELGEITIRGHNVMKGYWNDPTASAEVLDANGWFRTGDIGRMDDDGYFFIVDRKKDLIIRAGFNVYPREIEEVLYEHPAVAEAAVIGLEHPDLGEEIGAVVALRPGAAVAAEELRNFVKSHVAPYKYPRQVWIVDALPKGPTGKILKREIRLPPLTPPPTLRARELKRAVPSAE